MGNLAGKEEPIGGAGSRYPIPGLRSTCAAIRDGETGKIAAIG
jgi:hypothetical protein